MPEEGGFVVRPLTKPLPSEAGAGFSMSSSHVWRVDVTCCVVRSASCYCKVLRLQNKACCTRGIMQRLLTVQSFSAVCISDSFARAAVFWPRGVKFTRSLVARMQKTRYAKKLCRGDVSVKGFQSGQMVQRCLPCPQYEALRSGSPVLLQFGDKLELSCPSMAVTDRARQQTCQRNRTKMQDSHQVTEKKTSNAK